LKTLPVYSKRGKIFGRIFLKLFRLLLGLCLIFSSFARSADEPHAPPNIAPLVEDSPIRKRFIEEIKGYLEQDKFDELEKMLDELRKTKPRHPNGYEKLCLFYVTIRETPWYPQENKWKSLFEHLDKWVAAKPQSVAARIALANAWSDYAHVATYNGTYYVDEMDDSVLSDETKRLVHERLAKSQKLLEEAEQLSTKEAELYTVYIKWCEFSKKPREEMEKYFKKALEIDPTYYTAFWQKGHFVARRGQADDWIAFVEEAAEMTKKEEGDGYYTRLVWGMYAPAGNYTPDSKLFGGEISWERMKQGFQDTAKKYPSSARNLNAFAYYACAAGDRATAKEAFNRIANLWDQEIWGRPGSYEKWKNWASSDQVQFKPKRSINAEGDIQSMSFTPDQKTLVIGMEEGDIILYDLANDTKRLPFRSHNTPVQSLSFSPDGKLLASGSSVFSRKGQGLTGEMKLWEIATGEVLASLPGFKNHVNGVVFSHDGSLVAFGGGKLPWKGEPEPVEGVRVYEVATKKERTPLPHTKVISGLAASPVSKLLAVGGNGTITLFDMESGKTVTDIHTAQVHRGWVLELCFSPDGKHLASCSSTKSATKNGEVKLWDVSTGKAAPVQFAGHPKGGTFHVKFSPDGKYLVSGGYDETIKLWDVATGKELASFNHAEQKGSTRAIFSPDGKMIVSRGGDTFIRFWDIQELLQKPAAAVKE
jgi:WD40 repeat protein